LVDKEIDEALIKQRLEHYNTLLKKAENSNFPHIFALSAVIHELEYLAGERQKVPTVNITSTPTPTSTPTTT
jgi:hypothetical protein